MIVIIIAATGMLSLLLIFIVTSKWGEKNIFDPVFDFIHNINEDSKKDCIYTLAFDHLYRKPSNVYSVTIDLTTEEQGELNDYMREFIGEDYACHRNELIVRSDSAPYGCPLPNRYPWEDY